MGDYCECPKAVTGKDDAKRQRFPSLWNVKWFLAAETLAFSADEGGDIFLERNTKVKTFTLGFVPLTPDWPRGKSLQTEGDRRSVCSLRLSDWRPRAPPRNSRSDAWMQISRRIIRNVALHHTTNRSAGTAVSVSARHLKCTCTLLLFLPFRRFRELKKRATARLASCLMDRCNSGFVWRSNYMCVLQKIGR